MADSYTTRNRITLPEKGTDVGTWATTFNGEIMALVDESLDGVTSLAISGSNVTLTANSGSTDQSRKRVLNITSSDQARTITVPDLEKVYIVKNASAYTITLTVSGGNSTEVLAGQSATVFSDGATNIYRTQVDGWGLWSTTTATSGTNKNITITPNEHFMDALLVFENLTPSASDYLIVEVTNDASAAATGGFLSSTVSGNTKRWGSLQIPNYRGDFGTGALMQTMTSSWTDDPGARHEALSTGALSGGVWRCTGGIGEFDMYWAAASNFSAGTIRLYLR